MPVFPDFERVDVDQLGRKAVVNGRIYWTPNDDVDPGLAALIHGSTSHLNELLAGGDLTLDNKGDIPDNRGKAKWKWWGFEIYLDHGEACNLTKGASTISEVTAFLAQYIDDKKFRKVLTAVALVVSGLLGYIRNKNEESGGNGVVLKFLYPCAYVSCARRPGTWGPSPCG